jgi:hypothetical protein
MPSEIYAAVRRAAAAEDRSISSLVVHVLRAWLTERGHLSQAEARSKSTRPRRAS